MSKEETEKKIKERREYLEKRDKDDILKLLSFPEGRRYLWKLLSETGVFQTGIIDDKYLFFAEGKRSIGIKILNDIMNHKPEKFLQMQKENKADVGIDLSLSTELRQLADENIF